MATRAAIIVGSPGVGASTLPGVPQDAHSFSAYLRSDAGGAWLQSEITVLSSPTKNRLRAVLTSQNVDYSVTVFAGHGEHRHQIGGVLWINEDEWVPVSEFRTSSLRQLTIVDACRAESSPSLKESLQKRAAASASPYRRVIRMLYEKQIMAAEEGRTIMWSCGIGQSAGETPEGGYFTQALLSESLSWSHSPAGSPTLTLDVRSAFDLANKLVTRDHFPQAPVLENGRRMKSFPFAVAL